MIQKYCRMRRAGDYFTPGTKCVKLSRDKGKINSHTLQNIAKSYCLSKMTDGIANESEKGGNERETISSGVPGKPKGCMMQPLTRNKTERVPTRSALCCC